MVSISALLIIVNKPTHYMICVHVLIISSCWSDINIIRDSIFALEFEFNGSELSVVNIW